MKGTPMSALTSTQLLEALTAGLNASEQIDEQAFGICIVDAGGHVLASLREPLAAISAAHSAESKARTAIYLRADTGAMPPTSPIIPAMTAGLPYPINFFDGGLVIWRAGEGIGAVGVGGSGAPGDDLAVAQAVKAAIEAAGR